MERLRPDPFARRPQSPPSAGAAGIPLDIDCSPGLGRYGCANMSRYPTSDRPNFILSTAGTAQPIDILAFGGVPVYGAPVLRAMLVEGSAGR